jgi:hypothetical protein
MGFQSLIIEQTPKSPLVDLNAFSGELIFYGRSIPENAAKVYEPAFNWVNEYIEHAKPTTNIRLNLEYFNTASSLWLARIFKVLIRISEPDYVLIVHLYLPVEDFDDVKEFEDIKDIFFPISDIFHGSSISIGIKLYGIDDKGDVIKDTLLFV